MKLVLGVLALTGAENLKCWTCEEGSMDECQRLGKYRTCRDNSSCQVEWRSRYGATSRVKMGCKARIQINLKRNLNNKKLSFELGSKVCTQNIMVRISSDQRISMK